MKKISICIPCYKSKDTIGKLTENITKEMSNHLDYDYEIVLVKKRQYKNTRRTRPPGVSLLTFISSVILLSPL